MDGEAETSAQENHGSESSQTHGPAVDDHTAGTTSGQTQTHDLDLDDQTAEKTTWGQTETAGKAPAGQTQTHALDVNDEAAGKTTSGHTETAAGKTTSGQTQTHDLDVDDQTAEKTTSGQRQTHDLDVDDHVAGKTTSGPQTHDLDLDDNTEKATPGQTQTHDLDLDDKSASSEHDLDLDDKSASSEHDLDLDDKDKSAQSADLDLRHELYSKNGGSHRSGTQPVNVRPPLPIPDPPPQSSSLGVPVSPDGQIRDQYGGRLIGDLPVGTSGNVRVVAERSYVRHDGGRTENTIRFAYSNPNVTPEGLANTHWLQFAWVEVRLDTAAGAVQLGGVIGSKMPVSFDPRSPIRVVDTLTPTGVPEGWRTLRPWYEYETRPPSAPSGNTVIQGRQEELHAGAAQRTWHSLEMVDAPGPGPGASMRGIIEGALNHPDNQHIRGKVGEIRNATYVLHVDTYLVISGRATAHIQWNAENRVDYGTRREPPTRYSIQRVETVTGLPRGFREIVRRDFGYNLR